MLCQVTGVLVLVVLTVMHVNAATTITASESHAASSDTGVTVVNVSGSSTTSLTQTHSSLQPSARNVSMTTTAIKNAATVHSPSNSTRTTAPTSVGITASSTLYVSSPENPVSTTMKAMFPWKYISFGLFGLVAVLLIACVITSVFTYKLKQKLGQVSKTLYPIVPERESSNEYLDIEASGDGTHHGNVELTSMHVHQEKEFVTPTLPSTPDKPPRRRPPPLPTSNPPKKQSDARQGNTNANGKVKQNTQGGGLPNVGFEMEETKDGGIPGIDAINLYDHDEGLYEDYEEKGESNTSGALEDVEEQGPYEEPITKSPVKQDILSEDGLRRQDSSTGLPEVPPRHVPGGHQNKHKTPLDMTDEDAFESAQFDPNGIPLSTMQFDESQFFDFETSGTHDVNFDMDLTEGRDSFVDIPSHHYHVLEMESQAHGLNILQVDATTDEIGIPTDEALPGTVAYNNEPVLHESYEDGFAAQKDNASFVPTEQTFDPEFDNVDGMGEFEEEHNEGEEENLNDYENTPAPIVPPRRDLVKKQPESVTAAATDAASMDTGPDVRIDSSPTGSFDSNDNEMSENDTVLKAGKNLRGSKIRRLGNSYFLDINDKTTTIEEQNISPDQVVTGDPILDLSNTETNIDMASNNLDVLLADIPVIDRQFELSNDVQNPSVGDYINIANQPMADLLGDYENFQTTKDRTGSITNTSIPTNSPIDLLNGAIPNNNGDDNSDDVDYENAPGTVSK